VRTDLQGAAGRIEAILDEPAPPPRFAALVLHPHPLFGGTMHSHAAYRLARAARTRGGVALRFNFRGVGLSDGAHAGGDGETDDARLALGWLGGRHPALPLFSSGFSFGAWIAARAGCDAPRVRGLLLAGVASRTFAMGFLRDCEKPVAAVQAEADAYGEVEDVRRLLDGPPARRRLAVVPGATHLFAEDLDALEREAAAAYDWLLEAA
jgi:alpha/beta superfamily hydrolase